MRVLDGEFSDRLAEEAVFVAGFDRYMSKDLNNDLMFPSGAEVNIIPVMQGDGQIKIDESELPETLPILALRNAVLFPGMVYPVTIGRDKSIALVKDAERGSSFIGAIPQNDISVEDPRDKDLFEYDCALWQPEVDAKIAAAAQ